MQFTESQKMKQNKNYRAMEHALNTSYLKSKLQKNTEVVTGLGSEADLSDI